MIGSHVVTVTLDFSPWFFCIRMSPQHMHTRRRRMLAVLGTVSATPLAGCFDDGQGSDGGECSSEPARDAGDDESGRQNSSPPTEQVATLIADDGDDGDQFGSSVAVSNHGNTAIIGAPTDDTPNGKGAGAVYVFE